MRKLTMLWGVLLLAYASLVSAQVSEGRQYTLINPPIASDVKDRIEVTEFFWYGCPHCFQLDPVLHKWLAKLPKDVSFRRVPAQFRPNWVPGAKVYYALETMGLVERLHGPFFDATHVDRLNVGDEKAIFEWMAKKGVDGRKFAETYNSFAVQSKVARAQQTTNAARIEGVPALVVDGRYLANINAARNFDDYLAITDQLIDKVRQERARK